MLRHAAHRLASRAAGSGSISRRALATAEVPAEESGVDPAFVQAWKKVTKIIEPPQTPMAAMKPRPPTPATIPSKLTVNFVLPYKSEITNREVYSIAPSMCPSALPPDLRSVRARPWFRAVRSI